MIGSNKVYLYTVTVNSSVYQAIRLKVSQVMACFLTEDLQSDFWSHNINLKLGSQCLFQYSTIFYSLCTINNKKYF